MHCFLSAEDSETELAGELAASFPGVQARQVQPLLLEIYFAATTFERLPHLAFARQLLPNARRERIESIRGWASAIVEAVAGVLPDDQGWTLHIEPHYGVRATHRIGARAWHSATRVRQAGAGAALTGRDATPTTVSAEAGRQRCRLIRAAVLELLKRRRRHLLRRLRTEPVPFTAADSLVQVLLTEPGCGYLSVAPAPLPWTQRHLLSPYPRGEVPVATDKAAPSRAFAKLLEAERRMGRRIEAKETCVDLGAAPGSWTYVAVNRGAHVLAVDRSLLREDLMESGQVQFAAGDAFGFRPARPVDWLLCDVIAAPELSTGLLLEWLRHGSCRHFVVTLKLKDTSGDVALGQLKRELPALAREFYLSRLCANKKEVCAFGSVQ